MSSIGYSVPGVARGRARRGAGDVPKSYPVRGGICASAGKEPVDPLSNFFVADEFAPIGRGQTLDDGCDELGVVLDEMTCGTAVAGGELGKPCLFFGGQLHLHVAKVAANGEGSSSHPGGLSLPAQSRGLLTQSLGTEFLGEVPLDLQIRETSDSGHPITVSDPGNPHSAVFRAIAARIWEKIAGADAVGRAPPRIVIGIAARHNRGTAKA
jgi:hypothetical protein